MAAGALKWGKSLSLLFLLSASSHGAAFSFIARGEVELESTSQNGKFAVKAPFEFGYTNGWWQVEVAPQALQAGYNCAKIPGGVRWFQVRNPRPEQTTAHAYAVHHVPPELIAPFAVWLALCPSPHLPTISTNEMEGFRAVASGEKLALFRLENALRFHATHLPGGGPLELLDLHNRGAWLGEEGEVVRYPFAWREFTYSVGQRTNWNGMVLPLSGGFTRFAFRELQEGNPEVIPFLRSTVRVKVLEPFDHSSLNRAPSLLKVEDKRFPGLPMGVAVKYDVERDRWKGTNDVALQAFARIARMTIEDEQPVAPPGGL